jgi:hypothetical protein
LNWVLDADIRSFFDSVDHEWHLRMLAHRIADPRVLSILGSKADSWQSRKGLIKTALAGTYHHVSQKHAQSYLASFAWRLDRLLQLDKSGTRHGERGARRADPGLSCPAGRTRRTSYGQRLAAPVRWVAARC